MELIYIFVGRMKKIVILQHNTNDPHLNRGTWWPYSEMLQTDSRILKATLSIKKLKIGTPSSWIILARLFLEVIKRIVLITCYKQSIEHLFLKQDQLWYQSLTLKQSTGNIKDPTSFLWRKQNMFLPEGIPIIPSKQYNEIWKAPNSPISRNISSICMLFLLSFDSTCKFL